MKMRDPRHGLPRLAFTLREAAASIGLGLRTVEDLVARGEIPTKTVGRRRVIPVAALEEWLARTEEERAEAKRAGDGGAS